MIWPELPRWRREGRTGAGPLAPRYARRADRRKVAQGREDEIGEYIGTRRLDDNPVPPLCNGCGVRGCKIHTNAKKGRGWHARNTPALSPQQVRLSPRYRNIFRFRLNKLRWRLGSLMQRLGRRP